MARIPDGEIQRLKSEISLERLVQARAIKLTRHGSDLIGLCPFHPDREPSLVITPSKNLWHCLGACRTGGSVIDWVMKVEGVSFRHAVELLREGLPSLAAGVSLPPARRSRVPRLPAPVDAGSDDQILLGQVIDFYHHALKESSEALGYLATRGLQSSEMIDQFKLGFANRTLGYRLPASNRKTGERIRERLEKLGILRSSGHEHFNGSIVIPVFDEQGRVTEIYGRKITEGLRPGTPLHLYLPGPHRGVWNWQALAACKEIILCEALIDALTFWCAGFRNVTSSYGIEGFTEDHLAAFKRYGTERILIAYDRDPAGESAAQALAEKLMAAGLDVWRIQFPKGMDANEYALKVQPAAKSLGLLIRKAAWLGKGKPPAVDLGAFSICEPGLGVKTEPATKEEKIATESARNNVRAAAELAADESEPRAPASGADNVTSLRAAFGSQEEPSSGIELPFAAAPEHVTASATEPTPPLAADSETPQASPLPAAPAEIPAEIKPEEVIMTFGDRRYRIRGLAKNLSYDLLKVNVLAGNAAGFHVDTLDLYSARQRAVFTKQAAEELAVKEEVIKKDLGKVLLKLEELQDCQIRKALEPKEPIVTLTEAERRVALELLQDPKLLDRILADFASCGVVGEETNKLVGYLAAVSRKLEEPLAVILQSSTAAGKTSVMEAILAFMPAEDRVKYSAMTGQSLFYMTETNLKHKILAIVEEEGAERAAYALKLLQSEGELTIASTGKDPATGRLVTHEYRVEGPVMIFLTTTAIDIDEELLNRCLVLTVDEERSQTRAIHKSQRQSQTLEGLLARKERQTVLKIHQDAQRLLRPLLVANPYARELTFADTQTRTRRDHVKYLTLIRSIALLHQYQRPIQTVAHNARTTQYIEVTLGDIETANRLAHEILGRSLDDLSPQTRRMLLLIDQMVTENCRRLQMERSDFRFSRRDVCQHCGWSYPQVRVHLDRLIDFEYVLVHRGGRGQSFVYELLYDGKGQDGKPFLPGLIDIHSLPARKSDATTKSLRGSEGQFDGPLTPHLPVIDPPLLSPRKANRSPGNNELEASQQKSPENAHPGRAQKDLSYAHHRSRIPSLAARSGEAE